MTLAAILPYLSSWNGVWFFDSLILQDEPAIQQVTSLSAAGRDLARSGLWPGQELAILTFAGNHALNVALGLPGFDIHGFLIVNVLLHALTVCLVYLLILSLMRACAPDRPAHRAAAFLAAIMFAVHPLHATSVVYIVQRRGLMSVAFYLLALLAYLRLRGAGTLGKRIQWLLLVVILFFLSLKSKTMGQTLPVAILLLELCLRASDPRAIRRLVPWIAATIVICLAAWLAILLRMGLMDPGTWRMRMNTNADVKWGHWQHALTQGRVIFQYWKLLLLPRPSWLCVDHDFSVTLNPLKSGALLCWALHIAFLVLAFLAARRRLILLAFGTMLFYVALIPWIALPQPILMVEYKTYLSAVGLTLIVAELLHRAAAGWGMRVVAIAAVLASIVLATTTFERNKVFRSSVTLWQDVVGRYPQQFRGRYNLANALFKESRYEEALPHYRQAAAIDPDDHRPHFNLANTLLRLNRTNEAIPELIEVLRRRPDHAAARSALEKLGVSVMVQP